VALPVLVRAALPSVPGLNQLPGIRKTATTLPGTTLHRTEVAVERSAVERYADVCGFRHRDVAPLPYLHVLAFPLHLQLMSDPGFPFPAIGSVHLENTIVQHRPVAIGESVSLALTADNLRVTTKGRAWDMNVTATVAGEVVWESTSTYLRVGGGEAEHGDPGLRLDAVEVKGPVWRLPADLGRTYAAVSGDRNPIHLYRLTAKAFGFPRQIAHGMWSTARCLAELENRLPDAVEVEVAFKKPILLPGRARFGADRTPGGWSFAVVSPTSGAPHLLGRATAV
jgi:acyl dehydratase